MNENIFDIPSDRPVIVCNGLGVDSTAMLIALRNAGIRPDVITFADTGGEKPETLAHLEIMNAWCRRNGFPETTVVRKKTTDRVSYSDLAGNNTENETLPSLAFGMKSCSIKWKQGPQYQFIMGCKRGPNKCDPHPVWADAQARGVKPVKLIGYDNGKADLRRSSKVSYEDANFEYRYPLQSLGWTRGDCVAAILAEGLPVPVKSACYFCPASQKWELFWLAGKHPELFEKALEMEHIAMTGKHSRWGSDECTYDKDWLEFVSKPADQWPTTDITVGLGRSFAWNHWARVNELVGADGRVREDRRAWALEQAEALKGEGGNAEDRRTCGAGFAEAA